MELSNLCLLDISVLFKLLELLGSLSNLDYDGDKNVTNLHIEQRKPVVLHALHERFSFLYVSQPFSSYEYGVKTTTTTTPENSDRIG